MLRALLAALAIVLLLSSCGGGSGVDLSNQLLPQEAIARTVANGDLPAQEIVYMSDFKYGEQNHLFSIQLVDNPNKALLEDLGTFPPNGDDYYTFNAQIGTTADGTRVYCFDYWTGMIVYYDVEAEEFVNPGILIHTGSTVYHVGEVTFSAPTSSWPDWGELYVATTSANNILRVDPLTGVAVDLGTMTNTDTGGKIKVEAGDLAFDDEGNFYLMTMGGTAPGSTYTPPGIYEVFGWDTGGPLTAEIVRPLSGGTYRGLAITDGGAGDWLGDSDTGSPPDYIIKFEAGGSDVSYEMYLDGSLYNHGAGGDMSVGRIGCEPGVTDLIAGQYEDVGSVTVWHAVIDNDPEDPDMPNGDYLAVKFEIDPDLQDEWCITETHLDVETNPDLFPQTKKGNPIPGQFAYSDDHGCVSEYTYYITPDPGWCTADALYIAAHAVVRNSGDAATIYLSEIYDPGLGSGRPATGIFSVAYANNRWEVSPRGELIVYDGDGNAVKTFYSSHIAISPDGQYIYGIDNGSGAFIGMQGHLARYEVGTGTVIDVGDTILLNDPTQLAYAPNDMLYAIDQTSDKLYTVNPATAAALEIGNIYNQATGVAIDIGGADVVFRSDGYMWLVTNGSRTGAPAGMYKVEDYTTVPIQAQHVRGQDSTFTGLADTFDGLGSLIGSSTNDNFYVWDFDLVTGLPLAPTWSRMYKPDGNYYYHYWGDMTSLPEHEYRWETAWGDGTEFDGNQWGMYFMWTPCCH